MKVMLRHVSSNELFWHICSRWSNDCSGIVPVWDMISWNFMWVISHHVCEKVETNSPIDEPCATGLFAWNCAIGRKADGRAKGVLFLDGDNIRKYFMLDITHCCHLREWPSLPKRSTSAISFVVKAKAKDSYSVLKDTPRSWPNIPDNRLHSSIAVTFPVLHRYWYHTILLVSSSCERFSQGCYADVSDQTSNDDLLSTRSCFNETPCLHLSYSAK